MRKHSLGLVPDNSERIWFINLSGHDAHVFVNGKKDFYVLHGETFKLEREKVKQLEGKRLTSDRRITIMITTIKEFASCCDF